MLAGAPQEDPPLLGAAAGASWVREQLQLTAVGRGVKVLLLSPEQPLVALQHPGRAEHPACSSGTWGDLSARCAGACLRLLHSPRQVVACTGTGQVGV